MTSNKRPLAVTVIAWLYIAVGIGGCVAHAAATKALHPFPTDLFWPEAAGVAAIVGGIYLLRGHNWARWFVIAWMALHVVLSLFHNATEVAVHSAFCAVLAYFLFRSTTAPYFRPEAR